MQRCHIKQNMSISIQVVVQKQRVTPKTNVKVIGLEMGVNNVAGRATAEGEQGGYLALDY